MVIRLDAVLYGLLLVLSAAWIGAEIELTLLGVGMLGCLVPILGLAEDLTHLRDALDFRFVLASKEGWSGVRHSCIDKL